MSEKKECSWCELHPARHHCDMPLCNGCFELVSRLDPWRFMILNNTTAQQRRKMTLEYLEERKSIQG